jgi:hypothetical protein
LGVSNVKATKEETSNKADVNNNVKIGKKYADRDVDIYIFTNDRVSALNTQKINDINKQIVNNNSASTAKKNSRWDVENNNKE